MQHYLIDALKDLETQAKAIEKTFGNQADFPEDAINTILEEVEAAQIYVDDFRPDPNMKVDAERDYRGER